MIQCRKTNCHLTYSSSGTWLTWLGPQSQMSHFSVPWRWSAWDTFRGITRCQGQKSRSAPVTSLVDWCKLEGTSREHGPEPMRSPDILQQLAWSLKSNMCIALKDTGKMKWSHITPGRWLWLNTSTVCSGLLHVQRLEELVNANIQGYHAHMLHTDTHALSR